MGSSLLVAHRKPCALATDYLEAACGMGISLGDFMSIHSLTQKPSSKNLTASSFLPCHFSYISNIALYYKLCQLVKIRSYLSSILDYRFLKLWKH